VTGIKRLTALDALRGVSALAVVAWHWQHFFALSGDWQPGWARSMQPFFWLLKPLYIQGWAAVDLFFVLSGFVFFWLYSDSIRARRMGGANFALMRFSRLYPLQILMLVTVAVLQAVYFRHVGTFFIYADNDWQHFLLHLGMVQNWWPNMPQSFDGPSWSVSIEVLLYLIFFTACRFGLRAGWPALILAAAGVPLLWLDEHIGRGVIGFFMGGVAFSLWERFRIHASATAIARTIGILALGGWALLILLLYRESRWLDGGESNAGFLIAFDLVLCPLTVLALALYESTSGRQFLRLSFLGDISYSTYMLHFPMQLVLVLVALRFGLAPSFFMHGIVMVAFLAILIGLGALSYFCFEKPMQDWLRRRWTRRYISAE
jgi:peptidoglycan/LPS O-acetylase OafA/YrhL